MQVDPRSIHSAFYTIERGIQEETLALIETVNERHLHCEDSEMWPKALYLITQQFAIDYFKNREKRQLAGQSPPMPPEIDPDTSSTSPLSQVDYSFLLDLVKKNLEQEFCDPLFTQPILEALQHHILSALSGNRALVGLLCRWVALNALFLPLGIHLLSSFKEDMAGSSLFAKYFLFLKQFKLLPEARSEKTLLQMAAFLSEVGQAHGRSYGPTANLDGPPCAVMLSVKNGAGGHTAPTQAMAARLKERGWRVETIHYDEELSSDEDPFSLLGVTFEDGTPMTTHLYQTRWRMQKQQKEISRLVGYYIGARKLLTPDLFVQSAGGRLLRHKILPLNPKLLITTLAYHWCWKSLAYRAVGAKTLLVASDVFLHSQALLCWYRQETLERHLRQIHFTVMTEDLELLCSNGKHHDRYFSQKYPGHPLDSLALKYSGFQVNEQISLVGAPIHPAFEAITDSQEIQRLRDKWKVPEGAISVCISRGKLGFTSDLVPALEGFRTQEPLPSPVVLQVVCGENTVFYQQLLAGSYKDLGPNITVRPHPLLAPKDFAELRAISTLDDIKAGGGSTFEGWYLISKGTPSLLLLTPGASLWWEISNCEAMEKWGVGRMVFETADKVAILRQVIEQGLPKISTPFLNWKPLFDKVVDAHS